VPSFLSLTNPHSHHPLHPTYFIKIYSFCNSLVRLYEKKTYFRQTNSTSFSKLIDVKYIFSGTSIAFFYTGGRHE